MTKGRKIAICVVILILVIVMGYLSVIHLINVFYSQQKIPDTQ